MTGERLSPAFDGILLVDKPEGLTSAGVVREVKHRLGGVKVGHLGTLDPFATGLLPLAIGEGAKIVPYLNQEGKGYRGTIRLGAATDTLDATGRVVDSAPVAPFDDAALAAAADAFTGTIEQRPPVFSAIKRDGVPLYRLARRGVEVEVEPRVVTIERLVLERAGDDDVALEVRCSKGTYVRSLARDLAVALGTVGHLASLRRTEFGAFRLQQAAELASVSAADCPIIPPREALRGLRELALREEAALRLRLGQQFVLDALPPPARAGEIAKAIDGRGLLVAVLEETSGRWRVGRILREVPARDPGRAAGQLS